MTMIRHELKQNKVSLAVWTAAIGALCAVCILIFPEMKEEMDGVSDMFSSMGSFTEAFGMDKISFGTLTGFYAVECGNILGLGGAFFAALAAVSVLAKEEKEHTAEFLLTHPVSRARIVTEKLIAVYLQILILNAAVYILNRVNCDDRRGDSMEGNLSSACGLSDPAVGDCRNLLRHFRVPAPWQYGNRTGRGGGFVFSESDCEHHGECGIFEIRHAFRICRGRGYCIKREPGCEIDPPWAVLWCRRCGGCLHEILQKRYRIDEKREYAEEDKMIAESGNMQKKAK